jgi:hypothetical protein
MRAAIAPALAFIATATDRSYLCDYWHHLARGRAMMAEGQLINQDIFTYTIAGQPIKDVNWLTQILYARLDRWGGLPLVQLVNSVVIALTIGLVVHLCRRRTGSLGMAAAAGVFAFFGMWQSLTIRPQTFSFFLFVLLYDILDAAEGRMWLLVLPPAILALWVNMHGAFPAGLMLIGCYWVGAAWDAWRNGRRLGNARSWALAACLAASAGATLCNPYGTGAYDYVRNTSAVASGRPIGEWLPPSLDLWVGKFWVASLLLLIAALAAGRPRPSARDLALIFCFLPLACGSVRMIAWWVIAITPILAGVLTAYWPAAGVREKPGLAPAMCFGAIVYLSLLSVPGLERYNPLLPPARRLEARTNAELREVAKHLAAGRSGRVFSRFEWGSYFSCVLGPQFPVFMDARIEIFPDPVWQEYALVTTGQPQWQAILDRYQIDYLLLDAFYHSDSGLLARVAESRMWQSEFEAGQARLYVRKQAAGAAPDNKEVGRIAAKR